MRENVQLGLRQLRALWEHELTQRLGLALLEVACVGVVGLIPLLAAPYLKVSEPHWGIAGAADQFRDLIGLGQLYLYSFALVGTLFWLLFARTANAHVFVRVVSGIVVVLISIISISVYIQNPAMTAAMPSYLVDLSILCFALCLILYFVLLMCASAHVPTAAEALNRGIDRLVDNAEGRGR